MGDLIITAVQRGGDRDAFVLGDLHITYREMGRQLSQILKKPLKIYEKSI